MLCAPGCSQTCSCHKAPARAVHRPNLSARADAGDRNGQDIDPKSCTPGSSCPPHSMQYLLSKPTAYSSMPQCRAAAVSGTKCTVHNCAQQQSGLQQCLQFPAHLIQSQDMIVTLQPLNRCTEGGKGAVTEWHVSFDCMSGPLRYLPHVMTSA